MVFLPENLRERRLSCFARKAHHIVQTQQNDDFVAGLGSVCAGSKIVRRMDYGVVFAPCANAAK